MSVAACVLNRNRAPLAAFVIQRGTKDMALLSIRVKQNFGRVGEVLGWILVLGLWIAWFIGEPYRHHIVREGELCGPGQRWTYAQPKFADSDLSCEPE
jgi:hypothetical protein